MRAHRQTDTLIAIMRTRTCVKVTSEGGKLGGNRLTWED